MVQLRGRRRWRRPRRWRRSCCRRRYVSPTGGGLHTVGRPRLERALDLVGPRRKELHLDGWDVILNIQSDRLRVIGGLRYRGNASWPLAELIIEREAIFIRLRGRVLQRLFGHWLPSVAVPIAEVVVAEFVRGPVFATNGLRLVSSEPSVIFWFRNSRDRDAARGALDARGVRTHEEDGQAR